MFLRGVTKLMGKITLPAPSTMHFYRCNDFADRAAYFDVDAFFVDLTKVFRQEIAELAKAGCRYVQLDEVAVALLCDPAIRDEITRSGSEPDVLVDLYIKSINDAVAECPANVTVGVHMCRGNFKGHYLGAGGYELSPERFFAGTKVNPTFRSNMTHLARAISRRCASCPRTRVWCSASSARRRRCLRASMPSSDGWTKGPPHRSRPIRHRPAVRICQHRRR